MSVFMHASPAKLFLFGAACLVLLGVLSGMWFGNSSLDIHLHDTYVVVAHRHIVMVVALFFALFSALYFLFQKIAGQRIRRGMARLHFWITFIGTIFIFWPAKYEGITGTPRRYYDYSAWESFRSYGSLNGFISILIIIVFCAQWLFLLNILVAIFNKRKS